MSFYKSSSVKQKTVTFNNIVGKSQSVLEIQALEAHVKFTLNRQ